METKIPTKLLNLLMEGWYADGGYWSETELDNLAFRLSKRDTDWRMHNMFGEAWVALRFNEADDEMAITDATVFDSAEEMLSFMRSKTKTLSCEEVYGEEYDGEDPRRPPHDLSGISVEDRFLIRQHGCHGPRPTFDDPEFFDYLKKERRLWNEQQGENS